MIGTYRSSRPTHWVEPRPTQDPSVRLMTHGPVKPAEEALPRDWFDYVCAAVCLGLTAPVVAFALGLF